MPRPLWIDCDAGVDDAQAIVLAAGDPDIDLIGVSCVHGNVALEQVVKNVHRVLIACDLPDVPVYVGCGRPLLAEPVNAEDFHGADGLGDAPHVHPPAAATLDMPPQHNSSSAAVALLQASQQHRGQLTVVALGPLTNLALAQQLDPQLPSRLAALYIMGGAAGAGNITPTAEFNVYCDPEAAASVLRTFRPCTMVCWQCSLRHPVPWSQLDEWLDRAAGSKRGAFIAGTAAASVARQREASRSGWVSCDPLAMAVALRPDIVLASQEVACAVECQGSLTRGMTVFDWQGQWGKPRNVVLVQELDMQRFGAMMLAALSC